MGGSGVYFSNEPTADAIERTAGAHLKYGITSWLPTLISAPPETIFKAISATREAMKRLPGNVLGMHLEGPFLNPEKRGAHREALLRKPDDALLDKIIAEGRDVIRVRSEEHTSELQSLMRISYAVFCLKQQTKYTTTNLLVYKEQTV